jgi:hypothetical protein
MLYLDSGLVLFALWLVCLIDVIVVDELRVRNLPKVLWVLIVLLLPFVGSVAWLILGRPWDAAPRRPASPVARQFPEYDRPGRQEATNPEADEAFLRQLRERAEQQRERARQQQRAAQERARLDGDPESLT